VGIGDGVAKAAGDGGGTTGLRGCCAAAIAKPNPATSTAIAPSPAGAHRERWWFAFVPSAPTLAILHASIARVGTRQLHDHRHPASALYENLYTPVCFITFDAGHLTARIYTSDTASFADGVGLCNPLLQGFSLATLPPS
jgi:hypothetical protein